MTAACTLVVFGATGDLAGRHLLPALARLFIAGQLAPDFRLVGTGPQRWNSHEFQAHVRTRFAAFAADLGTDDTNAFVSRLSYHPADVQDATEVGDLVNEVTNGASPIFYLALPTHLVAAAVDALEKSGLPASSRIAVEKPFGTDLASAENLNAALARVTSDEHHVFRVDHFLGMPVVQSLPAVLSSVFRAGSPRGRDIARVNVLWEETLALEGRAAFYDRAGASKDLLQNHLVQILCQILLETARPGPADWSDRRLRALRAVRVPTAGDVRAGSRRARYTAGTLISAEGVTTHVPDYVAEPGVEADRNTETFAQVTLHVEGADWPDTELVLRAGKAMSRSRHGILVEHHRQSAESAPGDVWVDLDAPQPDQLSADHPAIDLAPLEQLAYVNVLGDLLRGSHRLSVSREETELAWRIFRPVLREWAGGSVPMETYPAGTTLPMPARRANGHPS